MLDVFGFINKQRVYQTKRDLVIFIDSTQYSPELNPLEITQQRREARVYLDALEKMMHSGNFLFGYVRMQKQRTRFIAGDEGLAEEMVAFEEIEAFAQGLR